MGKGSSCVPSYTYITFMYVYTCIHAFLGKSLAVFLLMHVLHLWTYIPVDVHLLVRLTSTMDFIIFTLVRILECLPLVLF